MSSGAGVANTASTAAGAWTAPTSITGSSNPSNRDRNSAVVIATTGAASATMNSNRAAGTPGSIGKYAAPALSAANIATTASADRENSSATSPPGPTP